MKIVCVCGMGLGSSVIAKINLEQVLTKLGVDAQVETTDLGSVRSTKADYYVTTRELADNMPEEVKDSTIVLTNFVRKEEMADVFTAKWGKA
ncbi:PTS sugar transporter subunit IIB [Tsukamurella spumae]|uniref:PTS sugar transporter subunit IIB n=1 Tax=Tsukamurella spumae TaxID=44753 RepID=A0A846X5L4_9ACTN|nr:PTS sugar transporter subunit IIB [Tsukamurella spumae]NKY20724.1 PTS sugar transporter subunit IIB [Tsukamurella spumae]